MQIYPDENGPEDQYIQTHSGIFNHGDNGHVEIIWTSTNMQKGEIWLPNHFVPLLPIRSGETKLVLIFYKQWD